MLFIVGFGVPAAAAWEYAAFAGERFLVGVGIVQWLRLASFVFGRFVLLFPGVFPVVDFLFRRGFAGGRVSGRRKRREWIFDEMNPVEKNRRMNCVERRN